VDTFLRRIAILEFLRRSRSVKSTDDIIQHLMQQGYLSESDELGPSKSIQRLIQRDLKFLLGDEDEDGEFSNEFGLLSVQGSGKSRLWRLDPYHDLSYDFEKMPQNMAIAFAMTHKHLGELLPQNTQRQLQNLFEAAEHRLAQSEKALSPKAYTQLKDSIEFYQRGQKLKAADYNIEHLDTIYRAIISRKQVTIEYLSRDGVKQYQLHVLGVAILLPKLYLIAINDGHDMTEDNCRHFLIHRIKDVWSTDKRAYIPEGFDLQLYLKAGKMDIYQNHQDTQTYQLLLRVNSGNTRLLDDLRESPISEDQTFIDRDGNLISDFNRDEIFLTAEVKRTIQLRNWLLALGNSCEVLAPEAIRQDLINHLSTMKSIYD
jgi:predicted DNA-binding transcriptional regulator YafY